MKRRVFVLCIILFLSLPLNAAAGDEARCASAYYDKACRNCAIDKYGSMDEECYDKYMAVAKKCVFMEYPFAAGLWAIDKCPSLQLCVDRLETCTVIKCPGTDQEDCESYTCESCYREANKCAYRASFDCEAEAVCGDGNCEPDKGEKQSTCCKDCMCDSDDRCYENECRTKEESGCGPASSDKLFECKTPVTDGECSQAGLAYYAKTYETVKFNCCYNYMGTLRKCFFGVNDQVSSRNVLSQGLEDATDFCFASLILPLLMPAGLMSMAFLLELPGFIRRSRRI